MPKRCTQKISNSNIFNSKIPCHNTRLTWAHHIKEKHQTLNNRLRMLTPLILNNKSTSNYTEILMYKTLLKPIWTYGLQLMQKNTI